MISSIRDLERIRRECRRMVTKRALTAAGASVVPVPGVDIAADIGLLATMLPKISKAFELDHESVEKLEPQTAERVFVLAAGLSNNMIGRFVTRRLAAALLRRVGTRVAAGSVAKYVPLLGSAVAASIGFGAMKLAGNAHIEDCYRTARALIDGSEVG